MEYCYSQAALLQALPAFRSLLLARSPVALSLKDLAEESLVLRSVGAKVCLR